MDDPDLDEQLLKDALYSLMRLNSLSELYDELWERIRKCAEKNPGEKLKVLDIATGIGDLPIRISKNAQKEGINLDVSACDISERSLAYAEDYATKSNVNVNFFQLDALNDNIPEGFDIIISSQFFHHLDEEELKTLVKKMNYSAEKLVIINDVIRSRLNLLLVWLGTRIFTASPVVQFDGPVSVKAAFTIPEIKALVENCGINGAKVSKNKSLRFILEWNKT